MAESRREVAWRHEGLAYEADTRPYPESGHREYEALVHRGRVICSDFFLRKRSPPHLHLLTFFSDPALFLDRVHPSMRSTGHNRDPDSPCLLFSSIPGMMPALEVVLFLSPCHAVIKRS